MTVSTATDSNLNILLIAGSGEVLNELADGIKHDNRIIHSYHLHHCEPTKEKSIDRCRKEIAQVINNHAISIIIAPHHIFDLNRPLTAPFLFTDFFSGQIAGESHLISTDALQQISKVVIHTYDPEITWEQIRETEDRIDNMFERNVTFFIEMSASFAKFDLTTGERCSNPEGTLVDDELSVAYYKNLSGTLVKILDEIADTDGRLHSFSEQFEALEKIRSIDQANQALVGKLKSQNQDDVLKTISLYSSDIANAAQLSGFNVGHVTYISDIKNNIETHLLDLPYKDYYEEVNQALETEQTWTSIYKDANQKFLNDQAVYFEYEFDGKAFHIFDLWQSRQLKALKKRDDIADFLPYLHSSIFYDNRAWRSSVAKAPKTRPNSTIKLYFLFSRLNNRSFSTAEHLNNHVNFSLWTVNGQTYSEGEIKKTVEAIKHNYFLRIKDIVQSTVILTIADYIKQTERERLESILKSDIILKQLEFVKAHKHTIRNFGYEHHLANLNLALEKENIPVAKEILRDVEKLNLLRDVTIDFIYKTDEPISKLLLFKILEVKGFHYSEILTIIANGKSLYMPNLSIASDVKDHPANKVKGEEDIVDIFNLFVNLYSNMITHSNGKYDYEVSLRIEDGCLIASFLTNTEMEDIYSDYLMDAAAPKPFDGQGLTIIKESLGNLGSNIKLYISKTENQNILTLKIN